MTIYGGEGLPRAYVRTKASSPFLTYSYSLSVKDTERIARETTEEEVPFSFSRFFSCWDFWRTVSECPSVRLWKIEEEYGVKLANAYSTYGNRIDYVFMSNALGQATNLHALS